MGLYILSDPPEVRHLFWRDRERILNAADERIARSRTFGQGVLAGFVLCLFVPILLLMGVINSCNLEEKIRLSYINCGLLIFWIILQSVQVVWFARHRRRVVREVMLEKGVRPHNCFRCGENVTSVEGDTCPRCQALLSAHSCPTCGQPISTRGS